MRMTLDIMMKAFEALRAVKGDCNIQAVRQGTTEENPTIVMVASPSLSYVYECNTGKIWLARIDNFKAGDYTREYIN